MDYLGVELKVVQADVFSYSSDLLVLKHAQASYGVDDRAAHVAGIDVTTLPKVGGDLLVEGPFPIAYRHLLFLGVEPIGSFNYRSVRDFSRRALSGATGISPPVREISMTLHGVGQLRKGSRPGESTRLVMIRQHARMRSSRCLSVNHLRTYFTMGSHRLFELLGSFVKGWIRSPSLVISSTV